MMERELTYATVCSGIECMSVACIGFPMKPVFFSEIEPFPCAARLRLNAASMEHGEAEADIRGTEQSGIKLNCLHV